MKELFTRISKLKKVLKYVYPIKRYDVLKCAFLLFLVTKWRKIHISNLDNTSKTDDNDDDDINDSEDDDINIERRTITTITLVKAMIMTTTIIT